jgi:hypothetical protein
MAKTNSVLIEKNIFVGVATDDAGDSEIIDMAGADRFSCQAIYDATGASGATLTFQKSNDGDSWVNIQSATNIGTDGTVMLEVANVDFRYFKAVKAIDSGDVDLEVLIRVIGDAI